MRFKRIYIEITNLCNKSCTFCSKDNLPKKEMSLEELGHILKEVKPYTKYLSLHVKGEPLLHSHLKEILSLTESYGFLLNLTTNGTLLKKQYPTLLSVSNIWQLNISLHSFKEEPNYIEDILEVTDNLLKNTNIHINYRFWALENNTLSKTNQELIKKIENHYEVSLLKELETKDNITIKPNLFLEKGDLFEWPTLHSSTYEECGTCYGLRNQIAILVNGTVIPCCLDSKGINSLGNIFKESFSSILESSLSKEIVLHFQNGKAITELCKHCTYKNRFQKGK